MRFSRYFGKVGNHPNSRRKTAKGKMPLTRFKPLPLKLEELETRVTPTVLFTPFFGPETLANNGPFVTLSNSSVNLIFWGSHWTQAAVNALTSDAQTILNSHYLNDLTEYGSSGVASYGANWLDSSNVTGTDAGTVQNEIANAINNSGKISAPIISLDIRTSPIYVVITDPEDSNGNGGYNTAGIYQYPTFPLNLIPIPINMILVGTSGSGSAPSDYSFGLTFSHEMAERMSDPTGDTQGVISNPPADIPSNFNGITGVNQIGDYEPEPANQSHYAYRLGGAGGVPVQPYWSNANQAWVVDDGNSQTISAFPLWTLTAVGFPPQIVGNFNNQYILTIPMDGSLTLNETGGGLQISLNGENFYFDAGQVIGINVNEGGGNDTVNVEGSVSGDPITITEGNGNDTVNISPTAGNLDNIQGGVAVHGGFGYDILNLYDSGNPYARSWTVASTSVTRSVAAPISYSLMNELHIYGGTGQNTFNVLSTGAINATSIDTDAGFVSNPSTVNVGSQAPSLGGTLANIAGPLNITSSSGTAAVVLDDSADINPQTVTVTNNAVSGTWSPAAISYSNGFAGSIGSLSLYGGPGGNTFNVLSTLGSAVTSINTNNGISNSANTVNVGSTAPSLGGTLANIAGPLNISNTSGTTAIVLDDSGDGAGRTVNVTNGLVSGTWSPAAINYTNTYFLGQLSGTINSLTLYGDGGGNTFNVLSTLATATTSINTDDNVLSNAANTVNVGSMAPSLGGTLANIAGPLIISSTSGSTALNVDDSGDATGQTVTVTKNSVSGTWSPAAINYTNGFFSSISSLNLYGGSGGNTFNVQSTSATAPVALDTGTGADLVSVNNGADGVQDILGALSIEGPLFTLTADDSADATGRSVTLDTFIPGGETDTFGRISGLAPAIISYELVDTASPITVNGGSGGNTFNILATGTQTLDLNSGAGNDTVNVQATSGDLNLNGNAGNDTVTLGSLAPAIGGLLANLGGAVSISNPGGSTALMLDDSADSNNQTVTISSSAATGFSPAAISYASLSSLTFDAGSGSSIYNVKSTAAGTSVTINAGSGAGDKVNVGNDSPTLDDIQGPLTINSQTSSTALNINDQGSVVGQSYTLTPNTLSRSGAALITFDPVTAIAIKAGSGDDSLTVVGAFSTPVSFEGNGGNNTLVGPDAASTWNIVSSNAGNVGNVTFDLVENLVGGSAGNTFKFSKGAGVAGTINGGAGVNTLDYSGYGTGVSVDLVGGTATGTGGVSNILNVTGTPGNDTIVGLAGSTIRGRGGLDTLSAGDNASFFLASNQTAGTTVTGTGKGDTLFAPNISNTWVVNGAGSGTLDAVDAFSGISNLMGSSHANAFQFQPGGSVTGTISGGGGKNSLDYSAYGSAVAVNLQSDSATGVGGGFSGIGSLIGSGNLGDMLTGPNANVTWTLTGSGTGKIDGFQFSNFANLTGGSGNDTFRFNPGAGVAGVIDGGAGANKLDYSAFGSPIAVNLQTMTATATGGFANIGILVGSGNAGDLLTGANATNLWNLNGSNAGNVNGTFAFSKIANLTGGAGVDTFRIHTGASISGNIDGGGAPVNMGDWLDYSTNSAAITVNLATGTATGVGGTVSNIQDVFGGNAGNTLTGDAQGNILIGGTGNDTINGGTGRSFLIGGKGTDAVNGGSGGDLMIGGYTTYDQAHNEAALMSILAEWQSSDSYATRILDIKTGGGLNGANTLVLGVTVKIFGVADTLTGGAPVAPGELDWFFAALADKITSKEPGEKVN